MQDQYTKLGTTEAPAPRKGYMMTAWICSAVAISFGVYRVYSQHDYFWVPLFLCFCINIFVLAGSYDGWQTRKSWVMYALLISLVLVLVSGFIEYFFVYKQGHYAKTPYGETGEFYIQLASFFFQIIFLLCSYLSTYFLYPDQLALLSAQHPAANYIVPKAANVPGGNSLSKNPREFTEMKQINP